MLPAKKYLDFCGHEKVCFYNRGHEKACYYNRGHEKVCFYTLKKMMFLARAANFHLSSLNG